MEGFRAATFWHNLRCGFGIAFAKLAGALSSQAEESKRPRFPRDRFGAEMFTHWTASLTRLRRWFSRNEWSVRLLGLPRARDSDGVHGLVLIQIDGLSRKELDRAMAAGRLPWLSRLVQDEHYELHSLYSGLPSSTPSVQGELFYGVRCATPAFGYRRSDTGEVVRMYSADPVRRVEERLTSQGAGLLQDGSAYCDIYGGGAAETHFCPQNLGWGGMVRAANPFKLLGVLVWNAWSFVRAATLGLVEFGLAVADMIRGTIAGGSIWEELRFVPSRVGVTILLRELVVIGATMDVARGVPIVHVNFLGYDEQAHRRGPASALAHWSLKGIDDAICRIGRAAHRSGVRHYDVWIYSDHGQESCTPYEQRHGKSLRAAVREVMAEQMGGSQVEGTRGAGRHLSSSRSAWLGRGWFARAVFHQPPPDGKESSNTITVAADGPVGLVYLSRSYSTAAKSQFARALVNEKGCPMVVVPTEGNTALAFTQRGTFVLPAEVDAVIGHNHPFRADIGEDLVRLCHHAEAGDLNAFGWMEGTEAFSFANQNGAHGGVGPNETAAFLLVPVDAPLKGARQGYYRPSELRQAVRSWLKGPKSSRLNIPPAIVATRDSLRVMTYNVHACRGMDGQLSPARIARIIAQAGADVVALQELDLRRLRTGHEDQAHEIARLLAMKFHFHPAWVIEEEQYGDAVLSHFPLRLVHAGRLPGRTGRQQEPRGALWVEIEWNDRKLQFINTHLSLDPREQNLQVEALLGADWLQNDACSGPVVLCGDFNFGPGSGRYRRVCRQLADVQRNLAGHQPLATWMSWRPVTRIDHLFVSSDVLVQRVSVVRSRLATVASDHLPLVADLALEKYPLRRESPAAAPTMKSVATDGESAESVVYVRGEPA